MHRADNEERSYRDQTNSQVYLHFERMLLASSSYCAINWLARLCSARSLPASGNQGSELQRQPSLRPGNGHLRCSAARSVQIVRHIGHRPCCLLGLPLCSREARRQLLATGHIAGLSAGAVGRQRRWHGPSRGMTSRQQNGRRVTSARHAIDGRPHHNSWCAPWPCPPLAVRLACPL